MLLNQAHALPRRSTGTNRPGRATFSREAAPTAATSGALSHFLVHPPTACHLVHMPRKTTSRRVSIRDLGGTHLWLLENTFRLRIADARQIEALYAPGRRVSALRGALTDLKGGEFLQSVRHQIDEPGDNNRVVRKTLSLYGITKKGSRAITDTSQSDHHSYLEAEHPTGRGTKEPERVRAMPTSFNAARHSVGSVSALISLRHELHGRFGHRDGFSTVFDTEVQIKPLVRVEGKPIAITPNNSQGLLGTSPFEWLDFSGLPNLAAREMRSVGSDYGWNTLPLIQPDGCIVARWQGENGLRRHVFLIEYTRTQKPSALTEKFRRYEIFLALWARPALRAAVTVLFVCDYPKGGNSVPDYLPYDYAVAANAAMQGRVLDPDVRWPRHFDGTLCSRRFAGDFVANHTIRSGREDVRFLPPHAMTLVANGHASYLKHLKKDKSATYAPQGGEGRVYALPELPGTGSPYEASIFGRRAVGAAQSHVVY